MSQDLWFLSGLAATVAFLHTLSGPDHYLPFIVMARARKWSTARTALITILCGLGHVGSSVLLGTIGIALGIVITKVKAAESVRGGIAAWAFIAFGLVYFAWGLRRAIRRRPHAHGHVHGPESEHEHTHAHTRGHVHVHAKEGSVNLTPWVLFTIFVFGPCEPLIPVLMYPAATGSLWGVALVTIIFGSVTIATMLGIVLVASRGVSLVPMGRMERYSHALAGAAIALSGMAIVFLGL